MTVTPQYLLALDGSNTYVLLLKVVMEPWESSSDRATSIQVPGAIPAKRLVAAIPCLIVVARLEPVSYSEALGGTGGLSRVCRWADCVNRFDHVVVGVSVGDGRVNVGQR